MPHTPPQPRTPAPGSSSSDGPLTYDLDTPDDLLLDQAQAAESVGG